MILNQSFVGTLLPVFLMLIVVIIGCCECLDSDKDNNTVVSVFSHDNADFGDEEEFGDSSEQLPCADLRGYAFHNETKKCWPIGEKGPCPELKQKFYADPDEEGYGDCDCIGMRNCIGRPRTYWPDTGRCYFLYSQGPCGTDYWLTFNKHKKPECSPNICGKQVKSQKSMDFVFSYQDKCYRTGTQAFCNEGEIVYISSSDLTPKCFNVRPVCRFSIFTAKTLSCRPGSKLDVTGRCDHMKESEEVE